MKATGIVRRIDDLGRVVIPKEIRRTMRIREGDPLQTTSRRMIFCEAIFALSMRVCGI
ncbi:MAG: AbrB/MazE/SpoVT family DNA-binding domain-containing protein [Ruminiclostridium sp.]|nr:AbrB/MazE/SpoVT family DNA-binding domain-containing protein [Ruminiclostridium sp.]